MTDKEGLWCCHSCGHVQTHMLASWFGCEACGHTRAMVRDPDGALRCEDCGTWQREPPSG